MEDFAKVGGAGVVWSRAGALIRGHARDVALGRDSVIGAWRRYIHYIVDTSRSLVFGEALGNEGRRRQAACRTTHLHIEQ